LGADVEDPDQSGVFNPCRSPGSIQDPCAVGVCGAQNGECDLALEGGVEGGPTLEVPSGRKAASQGISTPEHRSWTYALHLCSCLFLSPARFMVIT
jgi:hypothetical protein